VSGGDGGGRSLPVIAWEWLLVGIPDRQQQTAIVAVTEKESCIVVAHLAIDSVQAAHISSDIELVTA
jgi:hypothetical protein